jgi:hypothetical protein
MPANQHRTNQHRTGQRSLSQYWTSANTDQPKTLDDSHLKIRTKVYRDNVTRAAMTTSLVLTAACIESITTKWTRRWRAKVPGERHPPPKRLKRKEMLRCSTVNEMATRLADWHMFHVSSVIAATMAATDDPDILVFLKAMIFEITHDVFSLFEIIRRHTQDLKMLHGLSSEPVDRLRKIIYANFEHQIRGITIYFRE